MKFHAWKKSRRGIAMTEYLIILAIVAIAAIAVVGLFGKQIKAVFTKNNAAMNGNTSSDAATAGNDAQKKAEDASTKGQDNMGSFDKNASQTDNK